MNKFDDRAMILSEDEWPSDILCLKKRLRIEEDEMKNFGIITNSHFPVDVWSHEGAFIKQYDTVDALLEDGWIVD